MATSPNATQITPPRVPLIDERTNAVSREWYRWFYSLYNIVGGGLGIIPVSSGGTGLSTIPTNGQLLIGNGTGYTLNTLAVGSGISVTNGLGTITLANTGVLSNIAGTGISVSGATGNVIIANTGVLSFSGGTTGLTPATATTGVVTLAGTLGIANGGTNGSATPTAYGVAYGTGTAYAFTAAGTTKQALLANTGAAPTWSTLTTGSSILYGDGSGGFSNVTIGTGVSFVGGTLSATGTGGTVTSVIGTSPVVSSGGTTPAISLAAAYGDTLNPYAAKTANYVLAGPTTGAATAPAFRALVAADIPTAALSKTDDTNVTLTLGGSPTTALVNAASLTLGWTGQLGISRGGTNTSTAPSAYGVVYGNSGGTAYTSLANGTTGQVLSATTSGAPIWSSTYAGTVTSVSFTGGIISVATATTTPAFTVAGTSGGIPYFSSGTTWASSAALTQYGVVYGGGAGAAPVSTAAGTTGQVLTATTGGAPTWAAPATSGTVTSVAQSFTGGLISVAGSPITSSGTLALTVAGTSGGIPYFSSATTWATSAALAANAIVLGGGAGAAPATTTTGTGVVTALGINTGTAGAFVVNGGALGTPSSGTVTNLTGTASININGTVGATTPNTGAFTSLSYNTTLTGGTGVITIGTNQIYKDASGNVGIGNTAANVNDQVGSVRPLLVSSSDTVTTIAGSKANIVIGNSDTTTSNTSQLSFAAITGANSTYFASAAINCVFGARTNGQYPTGQLVFSTSTALNSAPTEKFRIDNTGNALVTGAGGLGYGTGSGGTVAQGTSRTTGVTLNKSNGAITMFSAAGSVVAATFTVTNSVVAATDTIHLSQKSGTNLYVLLVTAVAAGSFNVTFYTTGGVATDAPVINFSVIKAVTA